MNSQIDTEELPEVQEFTEDSSYHELPEPTPTVTETVIPSEEEDQIVTEKLPDIEKTPEYVHEVANENEELATVTGSEDEKRESNTPDNGVETEVDALNNNKVDVEIEPDIKSNDVKINLCSLSCIFNCFSGNKQREP